jgi:hypothetical protein
MLSQASTTIQQKSQTLKEDGQFPFKSPLLNFGKAATQKLGLAATATATAAGQAAAVTASAAG